MDVHVEIAAETLFHIGPIPITNSLLTMIIVMAAILLAGWLIARKAQVVPSRGQGAFEVLVEFLLGIVEGTAGKRAGRRIFPLVGGIFIFIIFANWSGLLPGVGTVGYLEEEAEEVTIEEQVSQPTTQGSGAAAAENGLAVEEEHDEEDHTVLVPFFRAPNADLNMTLAMALLTFTVVQVAGIAAHGVGGRIKHMADPPFLFPIELVSEISRIISLSARLFGNVFAGEVLLAVMFAMSAAIRVAIVSVFFPVIFLGLELLFGAIQALVFALLTLIYITLATAGGHEHEDAEKHVSGAHGLGNVPAGSAD